MPKNRKRRTSSKENQNPNISFVKRILRGGFISAAIFFTLIFLLSLLVVKTGVSDSMQNIFVFFFALLSSFLGAFISLRKTREKGLLSGILTALPAIILACLVLLVVLHTLGLKTLLMSAMMLLGGALGGIVAVNK